jgi:hypothetical protein
MREISRVEACCDERLHALVQADYVRLSSFLAEDLRYVHATGVAHNRKEYLLFARERITVLEITLNSRTTKFFGSCAVVSGVLTQKVVRAGESDPVILNSLAIEVWRNDGRWLLTDFQSTRLST